LLNKPEIINPIEEKIKRMNAPELLALVELGGYPNFIPLYRRHGYQVEMVNSVRKAQAWLKKHQPAVVVAEFYVDPQFRDRLSNLESLLATLQRNSSQAKVIVFIDNHYLQRLEGVKQRYGIYAALEFPIQEAQLDELLGQVSGKDD
jgi:DNA-binding NtrC family response regulator